MPSRVLVKVCFALFMGLAVVFTLISGLRQAMSQPAAPVGLIEVNGRNFIRDGAPFRIKGTNYFPKDYAWDQFWENYTDSAVTLQVGKELDIAEALGINTVRLFTPYRLFSGTVSSPYPGYLADFVSKLESHDIVAIVTLFDFYPAASPNPYSTNDLPTNTLHINTVINALGPTNPSILAWDIKNELDRDYDVFGQEIVKNWAFEMITQTRQLDPNHPITIGFYGVTTGTLCYDTAVTNTPTHDPAIAAEFTSSIDFVSMHYYLSERCFETDVQAQQAAIGEIPLLLGEFGLHTLSDPLFHSPHTETEQAAYYNTLLSISEAYNLAGTLFWTLNDFSRILPGMQDSEKCLGILRNSNVNACQVASPSDYSEKLAANVIQNHYKGSVTYVDLFNAWVDINTDAPPTGWTDNWIDGGALLRGYNPAQPLWSHHSGKVSFSKYVTNGISIPGVATSPILTNIDIEHYPFLTGQVFGYTLRDSVNGSPAMLHISVKENEKTIRLITISPDSTFPHNFVYDLRQSPVNWRGTHSFQIVFELVAEESTNGYSAAYEIDWIALQGNIIYIPVIIK